MVKLMVNGGKVCAAGVMFSGVSFPQTHSLKSPF